MSQGMKISMNFPRPTNQYARNPRQPISAKATTTLCEACTTLPLLPTSVANHSAPVFALDLPNPRERYIILNTWLKTGQSHGIQMLLKPYTKQRATIHIVPLMLNISDASL